MVPHVHKDIIGQGDSAYKTTEYNNVYKQHPIHPRENFKPNYQALKGGEFQDGTTQR